MFMLALYRVVKKRTWANDEVTRKVFKIIKVIWTTALFMSEFQYQNSTKWECHQCLELNLLNPRSFLGIIPKVYQTKFLHSYPSKQRHRTKVNTSLSSWEELIKGVPQESVLGPILFNLYLNDLFYLSNFTEVRNFADDTTFHACDNDRNNLIKSLGHDAFLAIEWFETNNMKLNKDKCHLLVSGQKYGNVWVKMGDEKI